MMNYMNDMRHYTGINNHDLKKKYLFLKKSIVLFKYYNLVSHKSYIKKYNVFYKKKHASISARIESKHAMPNSLYCHIMNRMTNTWYFVRNDRYILASKSAGTLKNLKKKEKWSYKSKKRLSLFFLKTAFAIRHSNYDWVIFEKKHCKPYISYMYYKKIITFLLNKIRKKVIRKLKKEIKKNRRLKNYNEFKEYKKLNKYNKLKKSNKFKTYEKFKKYEKLKKYSKFKRHKILRKYKLKQYRKLKKYKLKKYQFKKYKRLKKYKILKKYNKFRKLKEFKKFLKRHKLKKKHIMHSGTGNYDKHHLFLKRSNLKKSNLLPELSSFAKLKKILSIIKPK